MRRTFALALALMVVGCVGDAREPPAAAVAPAVDPSPLKLEAVPTRADVNYYFVVVAAAPADGAATDVWASTEQPFVLDALVTWLPAS